MKISSVFDQFGSHISLTSVCLVYVWLDHISRAVGREFIASVLSSLSFVIRVVDSTAACVLHGYSMLSMYSMYTSELCCVVAYVGPTSELLSQLSSVRSRALGGPHSLSSHFSQLEMQLASSRFYYNTDFVVCFCMLIQLAYMQVNPFSTWHLHVA